MAKPKGLKSGEDKFRAQIKQAEHQQKVIALLGASSAAFMRGDAAEGIRLKDEADKLMAQIEPLHTEPPSK